MDDPDFVNDKIRDILLKYLSILDKELRQLLQKYLNCIGNWDLL